MDNIVIDSYRLVYAYELVDAYGLIFIAYRQSTEIRRWLTLSMNIYNSLHCMQKRVLKKIPWNQDHENINIR